MHTEMAGVAGGGASGGGQAGSSTAGGGAPRPAVSITSLSRDEAVARRVGSLDLHGCPVKVARCSSTPSLVGCHGMVVLETQSAYHVALCPDSASASCVQGAGGTPSSLGPQCRGSAQPASAGSVPGAGLPMPAAKDVHVAVLVKDGTALEVPLPLGGSGASPATALILHPRNVFWLKVSPHGQATAPFTSTCPWRQDGCGHHGRRRVPVVAGHRQGLHCQHLHLLGPAHCRHLRMCLHHLPWRLHRPTPWSC